MGTFITTIIAPTFSATDLSAIRLLQIKAAQGRFPDFMKFVVTKNADGFALPAPIALLPNEPDPLQELIDAGTILARPTPWPHVAQIAHDLGGGASMVYLKARQMYFTWMMAAFADFKAMERGEVFVLSQGQEYADAVIERCEYIFERLPKELKAPKGKKWNTEQISFINGAIKSFPSTKNAIRSLSGKILIADEEAFHDYAAENHSAWGPALSGADAQYVILSTSNGPFGEFADQVKAAREGTSGALFRFYPWMTRPDHDQDWYNKEKQKYPGQLARFLRENPSSIDEAFAQAEGLVYPSFNAQIHIASHKVPFEQCHWRGAGVDWGGSPGNPNAAVVLGVTREGHVHQYDEYVADGEISIEEMGAFLWRWRKKAPMAFVECDWQNDSGMRTLRKSFGLPARRAIKKREGIDITDFLLRNNRLTIDPGCTRSIEEFYSYRWATRTDSNTKERYATATPVDHHADLMDSRRYFLQRVSSVVGLSGGGPVVRNISGRAPARVAV